MAKQRGQEVLTYGGGGGGPKIVNDDDAKKIYMIQPLSETGIKVRSRRPNKVDYTGSDYEESLEFGRDTNRLDYFHVTPFDVSGDDDIGDIAIYGGGGGGGRNRAQQVSLGISLNNDNDNSDSSIRGDAGGADGSNISRQVPVEVIADNGSGDHGPVQRLDQESSIGGSERLIGGMEGAGFWVRRWWEKWWLFLNLWISS